MELIRKDKGKNMMILLQLNESIYISSVENNYKGYIEW